MMKKFVSTLALLAAALGWFCGSPPSRAADHPLKLGVNIAGSWHMWHTDNLFYQYEAWFRAAAELGVQFVDVNFLIKQGFMPTSLTQTMVTAQLTDLDGAMRAHNLEYTLNLELANWTEKLELTPGVNLFEHPDGSHRWDIPAAWLDLVLPPLRPGKPALIGINCDEGLHNQLIGSAFVGYLQGRPHTFDEPYFTLTAGLSLPEAFDTLTSKTAWLRQTQYQGRLPLIGEDLWPDMYHIYARSGWTIAPKMLKDNFSSILMAVALGAALEYQDRGADLWVCQDLEKYGVYPGWSPQAVRSSLLMAYWLGVSGMYVENMDWDGSTRRHPLDGPSGSLVAWSDPDHYTLTVLGQVVQDFYKNYVPGQPRAFDWRDYRPRVAIVRLPDGATGKPSNIIRDRLLGIPGHPVDDVSAEWLKVWPILTHGAVNAQAITMQHFDAYPNPAPIPFFVPLDSVAVFDHLVRGAVLDSVGCFVVCGAALSPETFDELRRRTAAGATCIIARRLYQQYAGGPLPGDWLLVDDFADPAIAQKLQPFLGPDRVARFRFKDRIVEFRPVEDLDSLAVDIQSTANATDPKWSTLR